MPIKLFLGPVELEIDFKPGIRAELRPSKFFTTPIIPITHTFQCSYYSKDYDLPHNYKPLFTGKSIDHEQMPYNWQILGDSGKKLAIQIDYIKPEKINRIGAFLDLEKKTIRVFFTRTESEGDLVIDPMIQPLGSLLLIYFAHLTGGFLIHASAVIDSNKSVFLFSAVSGTGKSTMAKLWQQQGAIQINDDRLWIHKSEGKWYAMSTPMIWYSQIPLIAPINKIFLLHQNSTNTLTPIQGLKAGMQVMSNCIQHFHSSEMTADHLCRVIDFTSSTPIYNCGFKPDSEIVTLIRNL